MKMNKEDYDEVVSVFSENKVSIGKHRESLVAEGDYTDLATRLAFDCATYFLGTPWIVAQYNKGLNDTHLKTAFIKALKECDLLK